VPILVGRRVLRGDAVCSETQTAPPSSAGGAKAKGIRRTSGSRKGSGEQYGVSVTLPGRQSHGGEHNGQTTLPGGARGQNASARRAIASASKARPATPWGCSHRSIRHQVVAGVAPMRIATDRNV